jgi:hypothetical protein
LSRSLLLCATDEDQGGGGRRFDGLCGDFGRRIGRRGVAEGVRSASVWPVGPAPVPIRVVVGGFCARGVTVAVVDGG